MRARIVAQLFYKNDSKITEPLHSAANDPQTRNDPQPQMIPDVDRKWSPLENEERHGVWFPGFYVIFEFIHFHQLNDE